MLFGCEQQFLWGERCVTSQKTAAKETNIVGAFCSLSRKAWGLTLSGPDIVVSHQKLGV